MRTTFTMINRSNVPDPFDIVILGDDEPVSLQRSDAALSVVPKPAAGEGTDFFVSQKRIYLGLATARRTRHFDALPAATAPWMVHVFNAEDEPLASFPLRRGEAHQLVAGREGFQVLPADPCHDPREMQVCNRCPRGNLSLTLQKGPYIVDTQEHVGPGKVAVFRPEEAGQISSVVLSAHLQMMDMDSLESGQVYVTGGGTGFSAVPVQFARRPPQHSHTVLEVLRPARINPPVDILFCRANTPLEDENLLAIISKLDAAERTLPLPAGPVGVLLRTERRQLRDLPQQVKVAVKDYAGRRVEATLENQTTGVTLTMGEQGPELTPTTTSHFCLVNRLERGAVSVQLSGENLDETVANMSPGMVLSLQQEEDGIWLRIMSPAPQHLDLTGLSVGELRIRGGGRGDAATPFRLELATRLYSAFN